MVTYGWMGGRQLYLKAFLAALIVVSAAAFSAGAAEKAAANGTIDPVQTKSALSPSRDAGEKVPEFLADELLVKFREGVPERKKESLHQSQGAKKIRNFKSIRVHRVKLGEGSTVEDSLEKYRANPDVEYVEPNYLVSIDRTPNDPKFYQQWALSNGSGTGIAAPAAWDLTTGSRDIVVAVIDTGIDYTHQDLAANIWVNPGETPGNGLDDDGNGYVDDVHGINAITGSGNPMDDHFHGTHVAGIIGAVGDNGISVAGVNWSVSMIGCKFLDASGTGNIADAIECLLYLETLKERATNPVNILATNNSWGSEAGSQALRDAITAQQDILFVAAAGNNSRSNDSTLYYPSSYPLPNLIAVAATNLYDTLASFSNFGKRSVAVAAPGDYIWSTALNNSITTASGTSMAAPHVTGLAALIASRGKDWKQARNLILTGGDTLAVLADRTVTGRRIDAYGSLICANRPLLRTLDLPSTTTPGVPVILSVLSINCDVPSGPVSVSVPGGTVPLRDDGTVPDVFADDGIFTGTWIPAGAGAQTLTFASPAGILSVATPPLVLSDTVTVDLPVAVVAERTLAAVTDSSYRQTFSATGGLAPYAWSIASGSLPPGLNLSAATGEITGTPTTLGKYSFTIKVTDTLNTSDIKDWSLIVNEGLRPDWPKVLEKRDGNGWVFHPSASPIFADLEDDGKDELIVVDLNTLYLFSESGLVAKRTLSGWITTPAVADLDGDGVKELIVNTGYPSGLSPSIYAFRKDLSTVPGFPAGKIVTSNGGCGLAGTPVVADFDNDGNPSILAVCVPNQSTDPNFKKNVLIMVNAQGGMVSGWPRTIGSSDLGDDRMAAIADLDGDGRREIVLSSRDGMIHILRKDGSEITRWSTTQSYFTYNPVLADLNSDGNLEITVKVDGYAPTNNVVSVFDRTGSPLAGWPRTVSGHGELIPADIDRDGWPELIFPSGPFWSVWQALRVDGSSPLGWPVTSPAGGATSTRPVVGDINGDGAQEVLLSLSQSSEVMLAAYKQSGHLLPGYPKYIYPGANLKSTPAIGDLDGNGRIDVAVKAEDGLLYVFEAAQVSSSPRHEWPMFGHDPQHSNAKPISGPADHADLLITSASGTVTAGKLTYSITVRNEGYLPAAASITGLSLSSSVDYPLASVSTAAIPAGMEIVLTGTVAVPATIPPGTYDVVAVADNGNAVSESNETNNRTIGNSQQLWNDFSLTGLTGKLRKGMLSYSVTVKNTGTGNSAASVSLYLSPDAASLAGGYLLTQVDAGNISGGSEVKLTGTVGVSSTVPRGTYYLAALAAPTSGEIETDETNNSAVAGQFTVRKPAGNPKP